MQTTYSGPFEPPPTELLDGAVGWRHVKQHDGVGRWKPSGWQIVYPDHILEVDYQTRIAVRDSHLHAAIAPRG